MGVRAVYGRNPVEIAVECVAAATEQERRREMRVRTDMLQDNTASALRDEIRKVVANERMSRLYAFLFMACSYNIFRRVVGEIARPAYAPPPTRTVYDEGTDPGSKGQPIQPGPDQQAYDRLAEKIGLNGKMSLGARYIQGCNAAAFGARYNPRLGPVMDVLPPNCFTVVPDPDDPTRELGLIYDRPMLVRGRMETVHVFWDDAEAFTFADGAVIGVMPADVHPKILPWTVVHREERSGTYWDSTTGNELVSAQKVVGFVIANALRLLKTQGHRQLGVTETMSGNVSRPMATDQLLDPESPVYGTDGKDLKVLYDPTPIDHFVKMLDTIVNGATANHGLNRNRMNQSAPTTAIEAGLLERRGEVVHVMAGAENKVFQLWKSVSASFPDPADRLSAKAALAVDFVELSAKVDRLVQLEIWDLELRRGFRSVWDCVREDNPDVSSDDEAKAEVERNLDSFAFLIELCRKRNINLDGNAAVPGQDPAANGAMGPQVRDGAMTKDQAATQAQTGAKGAAGKKPPPPAAPA